MPYVSVIYISLWIVGLPANQWTKYMGNCLLTKRQNANQTFKYGWEDILPIARGTGNSKSSGDFIDGAIEYFLPWILRSADNLSKAIGQTGQPWLDWARFVELGVDNQLGAELIDNDIVADRSLARVIGTRLGELADGTPLTIEDVEKVLNELPANDRPTSDRILRWFRRRFFELQT